MNSIKILSTTLGLSIALFSSCAVKPDYIDPNFANIRPKTIVVLPPENLTSNSSVEEKLYPILNVEFAKRGYYTYSTEMTRAIFNMNKLEDAATINKLPTQKICDVFGAKAILKTRVYDWSSKNIILYVNVTVGLDLELIDCATGSTVWAFKRSVSKQPDRYNSPGLISTVVAAVQNEPVFPFEPIAQNNLNYMFKGMPEGLDIGKWGPK